MAEALLALGGNVGNVRDTLARAIAALCDGREIELTARSSDYVTPPWGVEDQAAFVNACIAVTTTLAPHALLRRAQAVECAFGRDRAHERRWGPRPLDIDLIAYDDVIHLLLNPYTTAAPEQETYSWSSHNEDSAPYVDAEVITDDEYIDANIEYEQPEAARAA